MGACPWVSGGLVSDSGGTLVTHQAPPPARHQPCKAFVGIRVLGFTRHAFCAKHNFQEKSPIHQLQLRQGEALRDGGSLGVHFRGDSLPPYTASQSIPPPTTTLPHRGGGNQNPLPPMVTFLPLRAGSNTPAGDQPVIYVALFPP